MPMMDIFQIFRYSTEWFKMMDSIRFPELIICNSKWFECDQNVKSPWFKRNSNYSRGHHWRRKWVSTSLWDRYVLFCNSLQTFLVILWFQFRESQNVTSHTLALLLGIVYEWCKFLKCIWLYSHKSFSIFIVPPQLHEWKSTR